MKVIMLQDVKNVGKKNQTVEVSDGYAKNFLFPRRLAVAESSKSREILANQQENLRIAEEKAVAEAKELSVKLEQIVVTFKVKAKDGKMFGNISLKQIEDQLSNNFGLTIDKRKFVDKGPLDSIGYYKLKIELHRGVIAVINVHIEEEGK